MNIGVLGGTFDPIHIGHLMMAEEVRGQLNLGVTLFVPAGQPWLKPNSPVAAVEHRVEMVRLAIADKPYFELATMEIERAGPSYTVDTIDELEEQISDDDELFFILGWGSLAELPKWREPARLIEMCYLVVIPRPGFTRPDLKALETIVPGIFQRVMFMDKPQIDISATSIRDRASRSLSIHHLVPKPVNEYIKEHRLYAVQ